MDPFSIAGLALGVASLGAQVFSGCMQGIQLLIMAKGYYEDCRYLNLRLRIEQQRLFAWSEASGLLDMNPDKINESSTFMLHRTTVIDLLLQIQVLFDNFKQKMLDHQGLQVVYAESEDPELEAKQANVPLKPRHGSFLRKLMKEKYSKGKERLKWVSIDKPAFEDLLRRFSTLNDNMTGILDARLQTEIHNTVNDTHRGVLLLHHQISDLQRLVLALDVKIDTAQANSNLRQTSPFELLRQLAQFKAFNEIVDPSTFQGPYDQAIAKKLNLEEKDLKIYRLSLSNRGDGLLEYSRSTSRTEAEYKGLDGSTKRVWIEWRNYDRQESSRRHITERVKTLAALLNHPKPNHFRTPKCIAWLDRAEPFPPEDDEEDGDLSSMRLGLVFERPAGSDVNQPPVTLKELLETPLGGARPSVTQRVHLACAIAKAVLYLHSVSWLHKGIRSSNIVFFPTDSEMKNASKIDYAMPILSGFDFSRPESNENWTEAPSSENMEFDLYRHPLAQVSYLLPPVGSSPPSPSKLLSPTRDPMDRESYRRSFDIYSLGIVLVEVAMWQPLRQILDIQQPNPRHAHDVRENLLRGTVFSDMSFMIGEVYTSAVQVCIQGGAALGMEQGDDEKDDNIATRIGRIFHEKIVKKLEAINV